MSEHLVVLNNELHRLHELLKFLFIEISKYHPDQISEYVTHLYRDTRDAIGVYQNLIANYQLKPNPLPSNVLPIK